MTHCHDITSGVFGYRMVCTSLGRDNPISCTYWYSLYACELYVYIYDNPIFVQPLYKSTSFTTGDQSGDRRDRNVRRSRSISSDTLTLPTKRRTRCVERSLDVFERRNSHKKGMQTHAHESFLGLHQMQVTLLATNGCRDVWLRIWSFKNYIDQSLHQPGHAGDGPGLF
jgi:hypothetical protein